MLRYVMLCLKYAAVCVVLQRAVAACLSFCRLFKNSTDFSMVKKLYISTLTAVVRDDTQGCAARIITRRLSIDGDSNFVVSLLFL
jgi:hypothetical protein